MSESSLKVFHVELPITRSIKYPSQLTTTRLGVGNRLKLERLGTGNLKHPPRLGQEWPVFMVPLHDRDTQPPGQQPCGRWHLPSAKAKHPALWRLDMWRSVASHLTGCDSCKRHNKKDGFSMANCENGHWVQPWPKTLHIEHMTSMSKKEGVTFRSQIVPMSWKKSPFTQQWSVEKKTSPSCWSVFSVMLRWRITASSLGASCNWIFVGMFWKQKFDSSCRPVRRQSWPLSMMLTISMWRSICRKNIKTQKDRQQR